MKPRYKIIIGSFLNPLSDKKCEYYDRGALILKKEKGGYKIHRLGGEKILLKSYKSISEVVDLSCHLIVPAFFDLHFHWVQDAMCLKPKDNLLNWLSYYVWPYEAKFKNKLWAEKKAKTFSQKLLRVGTLGGACYGSPHPHTVDLAFKYFKGDFVLGNALMTTNSPKNLCQTVKKTLKEVKRLAKKYKTRYALTPRFALSVEPEVMKEAYDLSRKYEPFVQTHLSENKKEVLKVEALYKKHSFFKKAPSYTEVYDACRLLNSKSILAHALYLKEKEWLLLKKRRASIVHCPTSNAPTKNRGLGSGFFNFVKAEKHSIPWALGSDIGAGPFLSMIDVMNSFVEQNKVRKIKEATYTKALYRSTLAGARILKLGTSHGNFIKGKEAHFVALLKGKKTYKDGEEALRDSLRPSVKKRELCSFLVKKVYYQGKTVF